MECNTHWQEFTIYSLTSLNNRLRIKMTECEAYALTRLTIWVRQSICDKHPKKNLSVQQAVAVQRRQHHTLSERFEWTLHYYYYYFTSYMQRKIEGLFCFFRNPAPPGWVREVAQAGVGGIVWGWDREGIHTQIGGGSEEAASLRLCE